MQNIIFNRNDYNNLPDKMKPYYGRIGFNVYALNPNQMEIDSANLPWWLSEEQYNRFKSVVGPYYRRTTRGFGSETTVLMKLNPRYALSERKRYSGTRFTTGTRISTEQFWRLPVHEKQYYEETRSKGEVYYVRKQDGPRIPKRQPFDPLKRKRFRKTVISGPTVGIKSPPIGLWKEID
jgi:hypothetical protein